jgi:molybdopterin synthase catalytic subunit
MPYIRAFVIHNTDFEDRAIKPMQSYEIGRSEVFFGKHSLDISKPPRSKKIPQLNVNIYQPLTEDQWQQVAKEASEYFGDFGIYSGPKAPKPLWDKIKLKLIALKTLGQNATKHTSGGLITDIETTRQIVVDAYPDISETDMKKMLDRLYKERERAKVLLANRLGKTEVNHPVTKQ